MRHYLPNILTILRFPLTALFLFGFWQPDVGWHLVGTVCFLLSALTDMLDGILARRMGATTRVGAFLDPLADKTLVLAGFLVLIASPNIQWRGWKSIVIISVIIIAVREIVITALRSYKAASNRPLVTSKIAKAKTTTQLITLIVALVGLTVADLFGWSHPYLMHLIGVGIVASAVLAAVSAVDYLK